MSTPRPAPILSEAVIDDALRRAEREASAPGDSGCSGFPFSVEETLRSMDADGWCRIGWVAGRSGQDDWDVWFHVDRGEVRHERHAADGVSATSRSGRGAVDRAAPPPGLAPGQDRV